MTRPNGFDAALLHTILANYAFYPGKLDAFEEIPQRLTNLNARFRIGDRQWVIKRYTERNAPQRLALSHEVQRYLAEQHFPVAALEITRNGTTLVQHGDDYYSVHAWVSGRHVNGLRLHQQKQAPEDAIVQEIARTLGHYHRLMTGRFLPEEDAARTEAASKALRQPAAIAERIRQKKRQQPLWNLKQKFRFNKSPLEQWLQSSLEGFLQQAEQLAVNRQIEPAAMDDLIVAHNDINWENLIFDDAGTLRAIIDFDNVAILPRQFEVGAACIVVAGPRRAQRQLFLEAYEQASGLTVTPAALQAGMQIKCLRSLLWSAWSNMHGNVADNELLADWCYYLADCLADIST